MVSEAIIDLLKRELTEREGEPGLRRSLFYEYRNITRLNLLDFYSLINDLIEELKLIIVRTIYATSSMKCCRNGEVIYEPEERDVQISERKNKFEDTLDEWVSKRKDAFEEAVRKSAEDECEGMGSSPKLCQFEFNITGSDEYKEEEETE